MAEQTFRLSKTLLDRPELKDAEPFTKRDAFIDLLQRATPVDGLVMFNRQHLVVKRGQVITSTYELAKAWRWDRRRVVRYIDKLKDGQLIDLFIVPTMATITICYYDTYVGHSTNRSTNRSTNDGQQDQEEKKVKIAEIFTPEQQNSFALFQEFIEKNAPQVAKLAQPFTIKQYLKIANSYTSPNIKELLVDMHNKRDLLQKYTTAYYTFNKWADKRVEEGKWKRKTVSL